MRIRSNILIFGRASIAVLALACATGALQADPILFTRPAVPIVVPPKPEDPLPKMRGEELDFSAPVQQSLIVRPQMIPVQPVRPQEDDDEAGVHPLLRDPFKERGPLTKDPLKQRVTGAEKNPLRLPWEATNPEKKDDGRALSTVSSFDWKEREMRDPRDPRNLREQNLNERATARRDSILDDSTRPAFGSRNEPPAHDILAAPLFMDPVIVRAREKEKAAHLERRMAFDQLLNPRPDQGTKPGSMEPLTTFNTDDLDNRRVAAQKQQQPLAPVTSPLRSQSINPRGPMDPTEALQERHARIGSADLEDPSKKFAAPSPKTEQPRSASVFQTPLLRQPIQRDIPSRKF